jgi:hypothetical protein
MRARRHTIAGAALVAAVAVLAALAALLPARPPARLDHPAQASAPGPAPVAVANIELGRAVRLDKRISDPAEAFSPDDTIYASVVTKGEADYVRLTARWRRDARVLAEVSQGIAPAGTAVSEFNVSKPRGWPRGEYEVEILVDGIPAGTRRFAVR